MFGLKTIEWFGLEALAQNVNAASARTGSWLKLVYQLSRKDEAHPRQWTKAAHLLRLVRPDFFSTQASGHDLSERQAQQALSNLLELHIGALNLPSVVVAEHDIWTPDQKHWVVLFQSRIYSHALTVFSVLVKTSEGLCSPKRSVHLSSLYAPRSVVINGERTSSWELGLWLGAGFSELVSRAVASPANTVPLEELL
jgi:hypothetical protein